MHSSFQCFIEVVIIHMKRNIHTLRNRPTKHNFSSDVDCHLVYTPVSLLHIGYFTGTVEDSYYRFGPFSYRTILSAKGNHN